MAGCSARVADSAAARSAAARVLADWTAQHPATGVGRPAFLPTGDLLVQQGDWTAGNDPGGHKRAFLAGRFELSSAQTPPPPVAVISWPDGTSATATLLPPAAAIAQAVGRAADSSISAVPVAAITASTLVVDTTRGSATVPAWDLTLADTPVHALVVAARAAAATNPLATGPGPSLTGIARVERVRATADGRTLTASFIGAPRPASEICGEDYTADTVANDTAVVLIVYRHPNSADGACSSVGALRTASAHLPTPLAGRPVIDLYSAQPVPLSSG
jgi:hypothetical protein